jgi:hypothetical protein
MRRVRRGDRLAGLDLPAEQARRAWPALQATERQIYPAASSSAADAARRMALVKA